MIHKLYTVRDRLSGRYSDPFISFNDETAKRDFAYSCSQPNVLFQKNDLELYYLGEFNIHTGEMVTENKPVYICGGESLE